MDMNAGDVAARILDHIDVTGAHRNVAELAACISRGNGACRTAPGALQAVVVLNHMIVHGVPRSVFIIEPLTLKSPNLMFTNKVAEYLHDLGDAVGRPIPPYVRHTSGRPLWGAETNKPVAPRHGAVWSDLTHIAFKQIGHVLCQPLPEGDIALCQRISEDLWVTARVPFTMCDLTVLLSGVRHVRPALYLQPPLLYHPPQEKMM